MVVLYHILYINMLKTIKAVTTDFCIMQYIRKKLQKLYFVSKELVLLIPVLTFFTSTRIQTE